MDNLRFILIVSIGIVLYQLSIYWEMDYGPQPIAAQQQSTQPLSPSQSRDLPDSTAAAVSGSQQDRLSTDNPTSNSPNAINDNPVVTVTTDVLRLKIDSTATIVSMELLAYPVDIEQPNIPLKLLNNTEDHWFIAQSGLIGTEGLVSNHKSRYTFDLESYELRSGQENLRVPFHWTNGNGIEVTKTFILKRGQYIVDVEQNIMNRSTLPWLGGQYLQLQRNEPSDDKNSTFIRTYTGGVIYDEKYEKVEFDLMQDQKLDREVLGGWVAMIQHYFVAAWIPNTQEKNHFYSIAIPNNNRYVIGYSTIDSVQVAPGSAHTFQSSLYAGPKIQSLMENTAKGLELTVDYGVLTIIGKPIFWMLEKFHSFVKNWGFAIAMVTLVIKAIFFPLSAASYRSMAKMRKLQPKLQAIKERYEDDKPRFNQEMMALYRAEKVNPLGGCLPILVQIPVFISLYWVLMETVELRQAPFLLWIKDLSVQDPYYVLPLIMGFTMWIQQRLNPTPVDPMQEKVMKLFPYIFTVFFLWFPAGLVLYWVVNNSLSILQQWYITRSIEKANK